MGDPERPDLTAVQMWRRLDVEGHDAARLSPDGDGWRIEGRAVFASAAEGPTTVRYAVGVDADWRAVWGEVEGFSAVRTVRHRIERHGERWMLDGAAQPAADGLVDLDFGFTPATNLQQIRRMALDVGERPDFSVAWFDIEDGGSDGLQPLVQTYRRSGERTYDYASPQGGYTAVLTMGESGFCIDYPGLWRGVS